MVAGRDIFCPRMDGSPNQERQNQHGNDSFGIMDVGMDRNRMAVGTVPGHKKITYLSARGTKPVDKTNIVM